MFRDCYANDMLFSRNAGALILNVTFGYTVSEDEDRLVKLIEDAIRFGGAARLKGPFLVDALPIRE